MPRPRPAGIVVIAVLNLVFGGLGLFCSLCSGVMHLAGGDRALANMGPPEQQRQREAQKQRQQVTDRLSRERVPLYSAYTVGNHVLSILFCVALVASGIGLLYLQSWARWVAVGYALASILTNLVGLIWTVAFMMPVEAEGFRQVPPADDNEKLAYHVAMAVGPAMPCVVMVYPAVVLTVLLLPSAGRAFRKEPRRARRRYEEEYDDRSEDDYDEDEDYGPRRRRR